jgi:hypothetical protein
MTDRVFEDDNSFEASESGSGGSSVELYVFDRDLTGWLGECKSSLMITCREESSYQPQRANFVMTPEEATLMKEFLIKQGY